MNRKIISFTLAFCLILNLFSFMSGISYATEKQNIRVRIEGKDSTLFNKEVTVTDEVYGYDILKTAIGDSNIDSTYYKDMNSYMINGLLEESAGSNTYWGLFTVNNNEVISAPTGISSLKADDIGDEMLLHIAETSWPSETKIPTITLNSNLNNYELTVQQSTYAVEGATVDISYKDVLTTDSEGKATFSIGKGIYDLTISKDTKYPEIIRQHRTIKGEDSYKIINAVNDLKNYYKNDGQYSFREALALNFTSEGLEELKDINLKYSINDTESASAYASNIMGLIAAGRNPRNYNNKDYVQELIDSQVMEGENKGQFIIGEWDSYPTVIAYSILALDMADAEYNRQAAVDALINFSKEFSNNEGHFGSVDDTAMVMIALANHTNLDGIPQLIDSSINYLKTQQLDDGGFPGYSGTTSPHSISVVIQSLVANNINPLDEEWIKNEVTMLDALLGFKKDKHFEYTTDWGTDINSTTEQAFTALADLYRGRSMYQNIDEFIIEIEEDFTVNRVGSESFNKGAEARLEVNIKNNISSDQNITFIVALYDKNENKMINYTYFKKELEAGKTENITGGFLIPESGNYEVRGFLWDNMDDMNVLANPIIVDVN